MKAITPPFAIAVDGREKLPYTFEGLRADAKLGRSPLAVRWEWAHLPTGDYSIIGCEHLVTIERKSKEDLFSTLGQHRDRFEKEHVRMMDFDYAAVVIEASGWWEIFNAPPDRSRLNPKTIFRTFLAWNQRYLVPWVFAEDRRLGEVTTYRMLERWWYDYQARISRSSETCRICGRPLSVHRSTNQGMGPVCAARGDRLLAQRIKARERKRVRR